MLSLFIDDSVPEQPSSFVSRLNIQIPCYIIDFRIISQIQVRCAAADVLNIVLVSDLDVFIGVTELCALCSLFCILGVNVSFLCLSRYLNFFIYSFNEYVSTVSALGI